MERGFKKIEFFFVFIFLLSPIGFGEYLIRLTLGTKGSWIIHFHAILMTLWCLLLIVQPVAIRKRRISLHRLLGKLSYALVPLIVLSMVAIMGYSYREFQSELSNPTRNANLFFPISQIVLFAMFYSLAIWHRKKPGLHMRYIIISSVTLLGPTIGRIDFGPLSGWTDSFDLYFMDLVLLGFLIFDLYRKKKIAYFAFGFLAFVTVHLLIEFGFPSSKGWQFITAWIIEH